MNYYRQPISNCDQYYVAVVPRTICDNIICRDSNIWVFLWTVNFHFFFFFAIRLSCSCVSFFTWNNSSEKSPQQASRFLMIFKLSKNSIAVFSLLFNYKIETFHLNSSLLPENAKNGYENKLYRPYFCISYIQLPYALRKKR